MIYQEIGKSDFRDLFQYAGRGNQFSYAGLGALYDWLEGLGDDIEVDVVGLCCEFCEDGLEAVLEGYGLESLEELQDKTMVLTVDEDTVLYQVF